MTLAINTGIIPLMMSPVKVSSAAFFPCNRITFVVPGLPDPPARGSDKPRILQTKIAADNEPNKYAEKIKRVLISIITLKSL